MMKVYVTAWVCILAIVWEAPLSLAEERLGPLTIETFITTADTDAGVLNQKAVSRYLDSAPQNTPYIDRVELRSETEEFDPDKQKYSLRVYPKGWGETGYSSRVVALTSASYRTEALRAYVDALQKRYDLVLDYLETRSLILLKKKLTTVFEDRVHVLQKTLSGSIAFDIGDLVSAGEELTDLRLEVVELENRLTFLVQQIRTVSGSTAPVAFETTSLIPIHDIETMIASLPEDPALSNVRLLEQKNKMELAKNNYRLEQAKNRDYLKYVQVSYDSDDADKPEKAYSFEVAIKLPFIHSDRDAVNRRHVNYMTSRLNYEEEMRSLIEKRNSLGRSLTRLIQQYNLLEAGKGKSDAEVSYQAYLNVDGMDPLSLLKIRAAIIRRDVQLIKTAFNIRNRFVELMEVSGSLTEKPLVMLKTGGQVHEE